MAHQPDLLEVAEQIAQVLAGLGIGANVIGAAALAAPAGTPRSLSRETHDHECRSYPEHFQ